MRVSTVQTLAAYLDDEITAMPNLVSTGALDTGSITSGFGTIDTGASAITTTGLISGGSLDIDNVLINGTTIGHTDDTDLITLADGIVTVAGEISVTTLDIGGTNVTSTAAELNLIDGGATVGTTAFADGDGILHNDGGTMKVTSATTLKTYMSDLTLTTAAQTNITSLGTLTGLTTTGNINLGDDDKAIFGAGSDLQIYHDGSHSFIADEGTGNLTIKSNGAGIELQKGDSEYLARFKTDNAVELYYNNVKKFETTSGGVDVTGTLGVTGVTTSNAGVVVDNITIDGTEIDLSSGDLTVDVAGDIILDAGGGNIKVSVATTQILDIANSSSDVIIKPVVDAKDIIFQQRDGTSILEINDGAYARFTAAAVAPEATLSDASTVTWNALTQSVAKVTLGGNRTIGLASGGIAGAFISILVIQDGTGSRTVTWNAAYEFTANTAPTLTTTANLGDLFVFRYNGAKWLETGRNLALVLS